MLPPPTYLTGFTEFFWGLMFCVYCATLGSAVFRTLKLPFFANQDESRNAPAEINLALIIFLATCTGLAVVSQLLFLLGLAKILSPSIMATSLLSIWILACIQLWSTRKNSSFIQNWTSLFQAGSIGVIFYLLASL